MAHECPYFEKCNAPICPLDPSREIAVWYADEEYCRNPEYANLEVIRNQKKISKINTKYEVQGIFTYTMLNRPLRISKGMSGINEDLLIDESEKIENSWILRHKGISESSRLKMRERMKKVRELEGGMVNVH